MGKHYAVYDGKRKQIDLLMDGSDYHMLISCTRSFWYPTASISKIKNRYRCRTWRYLDPGPREARENQKDLVTHDFCTGEELFQLLHSFNREGLDGTESFFELCPKLAAQYHQALVKRNSTAGYKRWKNNFSDRFIKNEAYVQQYKDTWLKIFHYPMNTGFRSESMYNRFEKVFGKDSWLPAYYWNREVISTEKGYEIYSEAYYQFLKRNPIIRQWIQIKAREVIDYSQTNIASGVDLCEQEAAAIHLQDISVRRSLIRLEQEEGDLSAGKMWRSGPDIFRGNKIVQLRDRNRCPWQTHSIKYEKGLVLNSGKVLFHRPEQLIGQYKKDSWWQENSVEDYYQRNRVLLVRPESLKLSLAIIKGDVFYLALNKNEYFKLNPDQPLQLDYVRGKTVRKEATRKNWQGFIKVTHAPQQDFSSLSATCKAVETRQKQLCRRHVSFEELTAE